jgi:hypothetical protein
MTHFSAELIALRANLKTTFDSIDAWREQAATDPHCKLEQLQAAYVRRYSEAYVAHRAALARVEARS